MRDERVERARAKLGTPRDVLKAHGLSVRGSAARCPFHEDHQASLSLYEKDGVERWRCHACDIGGDAFDLEQKLSGATLRQLLDELAPQEAEPLRARSRLRPAEYLRSRGIVSEVLIETIGITYSSDRVWMSWHDADGAKIYSTGRATNGAAPKYLHSKGTRPALFATPTAWTSPRVVVVEGHLDALAAAQANMPAFATGGTSISVEMIEILAGKEQLLLVADADEGGHKWRGELIDNLKGRVELREAQLPPGCKDLADVAQKAHAIGDDPAEAVFDVLEQARAIPGTAVRLMSGGRFALDQPDEIPTIWGKGDEILWAAGEPLLLNSPPGLAKTTLSQRLVLARLGIGPNEIFGLPVARTERRILYIAADRPRQAARSLRRMISKDDRETLDCQLLVWRGPLAFDLTKEPDRLVQFGLEHEVGTIVIDSLKDVASKLSDDETGTAISRSWQQCVAEGIDVLTNHHQRKSQADNRKPKSLDDVYGSAWITASAGSVLLLWGKPGDAILEFSQLKIIAGEVGPLQVLLDYDTGHLTIADETRPIDHLRAAHNGLTGTELASLLHGNTDKNQVAKARRILDRLVKQGTATRREEPTPGGGIPTARYYLLSSQEPLA